MKKLFTSLNAIGKRLDMSANMERRRDTSIHFLHIGKAAGTHIKSMCEKIEASGAVDFTYHNHDTTLADIAGDARYFFGTYIPD